MTGRGLSGSIINHITRPTNQQGRLTLRFLTPRSSSAHDQVSLASCAPRYRIMRQVESVVLWWFQKFGITRKKMMV